MKFLIISRKGCWGEVKLTTQKMVGKVQNAAKWASLTEISIRMISPITNMILARLLAPDAFGVVATINMIVSFVDMFTDAGFQKYLIQHEFTNKEEKEKYANVAFWTNLSISLFIWVMIIIFREYVAIKVGNPGLGNVLAIASIQLPITSFSSIQMALYRRSFNFKTLFFVKIGVALVPLIVTVPLAIIGLGYWAIIIGSICGVLFNAIILTVKSKWRPVLFYNFEILKKMISFSIWTLVESITIWLTTWIDTLIIGTALNEYYLGLYKTSLSTVNSLMMIVTSSVTPILFAALSRVQNEENSFKSIFYKVQKIVAYIVFPMGVGIFLYSDLITTIMMGEKWYEASTIIGIWGLTSSIRIVLTSLYSEVYRAKGRPRLSVIVQSIHLIFLIPVCLVGVELGFWKLVYMRALIRLEGVITGLIVMNFIMDFKAKDIIRNVFKPLIFTIIMGCVAVMLKTISHNIIWSLISIIICILIYGILMLMVAKKDLIGIISILKRN